MTGPLQNASSNYYCDKRNPDPPPCRLNQRCSKGKRTRYEVKEKAEGERKRDGEPFNEGQSRTKCANAIECDTIYRSEANASAVRAASIIESFTRNPFLLLRTYRLNINLRDKRRRHYSSRYVIIDMHVR